MNTVFKLLIGFIIWSITPGLLYSQEIGKETEILILGTQHLNQLEGFEVKMLNKVINKLDSFQFDAVCIESMPAQLLYDIQARKDEAYLDLLEGFGGHRLFIADTVQKNIGISFLKAQKKIIDLLEKKKELLTTEERKKLIYWFLAAADIASATLQYNQLGADKNVFDTDLDKFLQKQIKEKLVSKDEIYSLGLIVAQNRGLQKLEPIDNFQDEAFLYKFFPSILDDFTEHKEHFSAIASQEVFQTLNELYEEGRNTRDLTALFRFVNSKEYQHQDIQAQWKVWLTAGFPSGTDRARYSLWEMRNLQIAANILQVSSFYPGKRMLVIIGASHKSFIEKYLRQVPDIKLLKFE